MAKGSISSQMELHSRARAIAIAATHEIDWHAVYVELLPRVLHYFAYRVGDTQIAEDLAAATFERAWRKRNRYRKDLGAFHGWLFGIARKVAAEYFRRNEKNRLEIEVDESLSDGNNVEKRLKRMSTLQNCGNCWRSLGMRIASCCR